MKKYFLLFFVMALFISSCNENMPLIACLDCPDPVDNLDPQVKRTLIEEFTGVKCIGCPAGSTEIENMLTIYGDTLIAVSIHAGPLAEPYSESQYDFRTEEGEELISFLGLPNGFPSAVINRKVHPGEASLQLVGLGPWPGVVSTQTGPLAKISMALENDFDASDRTLMINVRGQAQETINEEIRLTIMITESGIVDTQLTPQSSPGLDLNYIHKHALRKTITAYNGDVLTASMLSGDTFEERYIFTLPPSWIPANCEVIAFTHLSESSKEILQVLEAHVTN